MEGEEIVGRNIHMYVCTYIHTYFTYLHIHVYLCTYILYICNIVHTYTHVCMYYKIHMYIHTYIRSSCDTCACTYVPWFGL